MGIFTDKPEDFSEDFGLECGRKINKMRLHKILMLIDEIRKSTCLRGLEEANLKSAEHTIMRVYNCHK